MTENNDKLTKTVRIIFHVVNIIADRARTTTNRQHIPTSLQRFHRNTTSLIRSMKQEKVLFVIKHI